MSVPESILWLENTRQEAAHGGPHGADAIYAATLLSELRRLSEALDACAREVEKLEDLRAEAQALHRAAQGALHDLEENVQLARQNWDTKVTDLESRLTATKEKLAFAEGVLKDVHYGLLKQPELTREDLAQAITSAVTPYTEGEKP